MYLRARHVTICNQRSQHAAELRRLALESEGLARELRLEDPLTPEPDDDMGWDNPVLLPQTSKRVVVEPPRPIEIPLIGPEDYLEISKNQYKEYVAACRNVVPWRALYSEKDLC